MDRAQENISLWSDIQDIDDILNQYNRNGVLDREKAINKIRKLQLTNRNIGVAVAKTFPFSFIPFNKASNDQLVSELNAYKAILMKKCLRNAWEDTHANPSTD